MANEDNKSVGFIRLYRSFIEWGWYYDIPTCRLFLHLIITANWRDKKWLNLTIPRGSRITTRKKLSEETGLTERQVRTALDHLRSTGEITSRLVKVGSYGATNRMTLVTVENYSFYQTDTRQSTEQRPSNNQTPTEQRPSNDQTPTEQRPSNDQTPTEQRPQLNEYKERNEGKECNELKKYSRVKPDIIPGDIKEVVNYLNEKCGKHYRASSKSVQKFIGGRLNDGATVDEMKHVIDVKAKQWKDDQKMNQYLRPETLFNETKFESYRNETEPVTEKDTLEAIARGDIKIDPEFDIFNPWAWKDRDKKEGVN